ncbi:hypothetical protein [Marinibactrum halimedae]|uniref:Uncharacterized protein n=1 Tax=Marinibactrum halimedae TaxID=1444977 RepID=A0AA37WNL0_9GAMM|nr:hypothetical protein [Marinibactrum halimedae]MCD9458486.1 hypothetical protein [Marinibactrum halimedae]GLS26181.1 hypothetical protein GCM10007877_18960 [Marinibactrum halimedae]
MKFRLDESDTCTVLEIDPFSKTASAPFDAAIAVTALHGLGEEIHISILKYGAYTKESIAVYATTLNLANRIAHKAVDAKGLKYVFENINPVAEYLMLTKKEKPKCH